MPVAFAGYLQVFKCVPFDFIWCGTFDSFFGMGRICGVGLVLGGALLLGAAAAPQGRHWGAPLPLARGLQERMQHCWGTLARSACAGQGARSTSTRRQGRFSVWYRAATPFHDLVAPLLGLGPDLWGCCRCTYHPRGHLFARRSCTGQSSSLRPPNMPQHDSRRHFMQCHIQETSHEQSMYEAG